MSVPLAQCLSNRLDGVWFVSFTVTPKLWASSPGRETMLCGRREEKAKVKGKS